MTTKQQQPQILFWWIGMHSLKTYHPLIEEIQVRRILIIVGAVHQGAVFVRGQYTQILDQIVRKPDGLWVGAESETRTDIDASQRHVPATKKNQTARESPTPIKRQGEMRWRQQRRWMTWIWLLNCEMEMCMKARSRYVQEFWYKPKHDHEMYIIIICEHREFVPVRILAMNILHKAHRHRTRHRIRPTFWQEVRRRREAAGLQKRLTRKLQIGGVDKWTHFKPRVADRIVETEGVGRSKGECPVRVDRIVGGANVETRQSERREDDGSGMGKANKKSVEIATQTLSDCSSGVKSKKTPTWQWWQAWCIYTPTWSSDHKGHPKISDKTDFESNIPAEKFWVLEQKSTWI